MKLSWQDGMGLQPVYFGKKGESAVLKTPTETAVGKEVLFDDLTVDTEYYYSLTETGEKIYFTTQGTDAEFRFIAYADSQNSATATAACASLIKDNFQKIVSCA